RAYESTSFNAVTDSTLATLPGSNASSLYYDFDLGAGVDTRQQITLNNGQRFRPAFQWDDPFYVNGGVDTNLDIFLLDSSGTVVASSDDNNILNWTPFELFDFTNTTGSTQNYDVVIRLTQGPTPGRIKYVNFSTNDITSEYPLDAPTVNPHAAAENGRAVAAIPFFDQTTPEAFTSEGPSTFLFEPDGTPKATPEIRQTPDFAAIDGTDTTFFGQTISGDGNSFPNFFGTSAAAPHAAAIAALVNQANPTFTPADIYNALETTAIDIGAAGFDNVTGFGLINAYDAIFGSVVPASLNFTDDFEDGDLPIAYETNTNGAGRIQVTTDNNPIGAQHLTLDSSRNGVDSLNEVILHVDTTGLSNIQLSFDQRKFGDEDNPMSPSFTGSEDSDGVALSVDGTNWFRLISLTGSNSTETYQTQNFDLSAFAASNSLTLGSDVQIKFQQFDNFAIDSSNSSNTDGFAFDNISVSGTPTTLPVVIDGTDARDSLNGTTFNDRITGMQGGDTLTGGTGDDEFVYTSFRDAGDRITDFVANSDLIDLSQLFDSLSLGSLDYSSATSGGYLSFVDSGADSIIFIDSDGSSNPGRATPFIIVENIVSGTLDNSNNFVI
ncbi:MAG: S8 family serine peptidase, partial [Cyanobacteria bacterium J06628_3]